MNIDRAGWTIQYWFSPSSSRECLPCTGRSRRGRGWGCVIREDEVASVAPWCKLALLVGKLFEESAREGLGREMKLVEGFIAVRLTVARVAIRRDVFVNEVAMMVDE